jgi:23S rRNA C2498 (ribose-2'-O)-methylase RlmM
MARRNSNEQSIKQVIGELFERNHMKGKLLEINIINNWEKLMGSMIAKNTTKIFFNKGKLNLFIESAPLRNELHLSRARIVEIVNKEAGEQLIEDVVVR